LLGDSHAKKYATDLQHNLGDDYEVTSFVKLGAGMEEILSSSSDSVKSLSNNDVLIVWGGSNDISRNNTKEAIHQLCKFSEQKTTVNLVIMKVPLRHDLMPSSCVNNEVLKFNRQIEKRVKFYPNVKLLDFDLDRSYYTNHGQHLNSPGKELIANKLAILIKDVLVKKQLIPIQMPWKELLEENNQSQRTSENLALNTETSKYPPQIEIEKIESSDQKT
jgi:lysophospholipase L1-like esterase